MLAAPDAGRVTVLPPITMTPLEFEPEPAPEEPGEPGEPGDPGDESEDPEEPDEPDPAVGTDTATPFTVTVPPGATV